MYIHRLNWLEKKIGENNLKEFFMLPQRLKLARDLN